MAEMLSRLRFYSRFTLLAVSVLLVLGLNQRAVSVLRQASPDRLSTPPKATVVKQKVLLEATGAAFHFGAPAADAWLPLPLLAATWLPGLRHCLRAVALPAAGPGETFCARLLAGCLSPQAP